MRINSFFKSFKFIRRVLGKFPEKLRVSLPISLKRSKDGLFIASVKQKVDDKEADLLENIESMPFTKYLGYFRRS